MSKKLTDDQSKIDLVARLVKEGKIDFTEAISLLGENVEKEYISYPSFPIYPYQFEPYKVTCYPDTVTTSASTTDFVFSDSLKKVRSACTSTEN